MKLIYKLLLALTIVLLLWLVLAVMAPPHTDQAMEQPKAVAISSSIDGTYAALDENGTLWLWGNNQYGQIGDGTTMHPARGTVFPPVMTPIDHVVEAITTGANTVALKDDGTVWEWGQISSSRDGESVLTSRQIPGLTDIKHISAGPSHAFAIDDNGSVWAWGNNIYGSFGNGENGTYAGENGTYAYPPILLSITGVRDISCGPGTTAMIKDDGTVWTAGYGDNGSGTCEDYEHPTFQPELTMVPITDVAVISIGSGGLTLALKNDGTVWGWGNNADFELGNYTLTNAQLTPVRVGGLADVIAVSAGSNYGLALKKDGTVWAWGRNDLGSLGNGVYQQFKTAEPIEIAGLDHVKAISARATPGIALKDDGTVWTWGLPQSGQGVPPWESDQKLRKIFGGSPEQSNSPASEPTITPQPTRPALDGKYAEFGESNMTTQGWASSVNDTIRHLAFDGAGCLYAFGDQTIYHLNENGEQMWNVSIPSQWKIYETYWRTSFNFLSSSLLSRIPSQQVFDTNNGYLYLYLTPSQPYPSYSNYFDNKISTDELVWALMAIAPDGQIAWILPLVTDKEYLDSTTVRAIGDRVYLFHNYNETVIDKEGHIVFTIPDISDPAAIDEQGNLYVTRTIKRFMEASGNGYSDYRLPSSIIEAYDPDGSLLWSKDMGERLFRQSVAEEIRPVFSALPIYQNGTLYVPVKNGIVSLDTSGNEKWSKRFSDGYYGLFNLMPLDDAGNVYLGYFGIMGQSPRADKLYMIGNDGKVAAGPRSYNGVYCGNNHPAAVNGIIYETEMKNLNSKTPVDDLPYATIRAYDIANDTYLWLYRINLSTRTIVTINDSEARYIGDFLERGYSDPVKHMDEVLGRNLSYTPEPSYYVMDYIDVIPGADAVYVSFRALKYEYPVTLGQSKAAYASGVYTFSPDGKPLVKTEAGSLISVVAVNNSTLFFGTVDGRISTTAATVGAVAVAGIALLGAIAVFAKLFLFGTVARARSQLDKNENRNIVSAYVREHPGSTLYDILRGTQMNMGTVRYHVFILKMNHKIATFDDGKFVRYFPNSNSYSKEEQIVISLMRREATGRIINALVSTPGLTNAELSQRLCQPDSAMSKLLKELCSKDILEKSITHDNRLTYHVKEWCAGVLEKNTRHIDGTADLPV